VATAGVVGCDPLHVPRAQSALYMGVAGCSRSLLPRAMCAATAAMCRTCARHVGRPLLHSNVKAGERDCPLGRMQPIVNGQVQYVASDTCLWREWLLPAEVAA
jgi:hypothetical protein